MADFGGGYDRNDDEDGNPFAPPPLNEDEGETPELPDLAMYLETRPFIGKQRVYLLIVENDRLILEPDHGHHDPYELDPGALVMDRDETHQRVEFRDTGIVVEMPGQKPLELFFAQSRASFRLSGHETRTPEPQLQLAKIEAWVIGFNRPSHTAYDRAKSRILSTAVGFAVVHLVISFFSLLIVLINFRTQGLLQLGTDLFAFLLTGLSFAGVVGKQSRKALRLSAIVMAVWVVGFCWANGAYGYAAVEHFVPFLWKSCCLPVGFTIAVIVHNLSTAARLGPVEKYLAEVERAEVERE